VLPEGSVHGAASRLRLGLVGPRSTPPSRNEFKAITRCISALPETQTIYEMGKARDVQVIRWRRPRPAAPATPTTNQRRNCAAGTGSFRDSSEPQLYDIEDVVDIVSTPARPQQRRPCSVFAKSDCPAQRRATSRPMFCAALHAVMRTSRAHRQEQGHRRAGGVHRRVPPTRARALAARGFGLQERRTVHSPYHASIGAIGARCSRPTGSRARGAVWGSRREAAGGGFRARSRLLEPRGAAAATWPGRPSSPATRSTTLHGHRHRSDTTNLVVINDYARCSRRLHQTTRARGGLSKAWPTSRRARRRINRCRRTTGSARAQRRAHRGGHHHRRDHADKTGADFIARKIDKHCDTIFENGGRTAIHQLQDASSSDFAMNAACAACTGSFLECRRRSSHSIMRFAELRQGPGANPPWGERARCSWSATDGLPAARRAPDDLVAVSPSACANYLNPWCASATSAT